jgi:hypothetical protein
MSFNMARDCSGYLNMNRLNLSLPALLLLSLLVFFGCATAPPATGTRPFSFPEDSFAFENELAWEYGFDEAGQWTHRPREPKPDYAHHCFAMARSARQFRQYAVFDPAQPALDEEGYAQLIRRVVTTNPRRTLPPEEQIVIPGYANLREFSQSQERVLKANLGGARQSYLQRGNWRLVFPFSRRHQERTAAELLEKIRHRQAPVVHLVRFPQLTINHAVVFIGVEEGEEEIRFIAYDPNNSERPAVLTFSREDRTFYLPANNYFAGGRVDAYEIYHALCY